MWKTTRWTEKDQAEWEKVWPEAKKVITLVFESAKRGAKSKQGRS